MTATTHHSQLGEQIFCISSTTLRVHHSHSQKTHTHRIFDPKTHSTAQHCTYISKTSPTLTIFHKCRVVIYIMVGNQDDGNNRNRRGKGNKNKNEKGGDEDYSYCDGSCIWNANGYVNGTSLTMPTPTSPLMDKSANPLAEVAAVNFDKYIPKAVTRDFTLEVIA
jgi:hypothetical protein